ncbi:MAG: hypothetical protein COU47_04370 [Candidatus Niyogibacteria bacterium CG10_big_fil_rev_8_21_14_0_10_46_36]|uniref:Glycosyltransferase 2-like domain-containing protein n=1 Tax=Candidatus Niyogibacteria bacterium CG10_big_fil_rev_8_21_14_0_10_46_36 TaxID=1974726 RepID=A0A2H0TCL0_9BACT|nr:MAG: hypothetical protein COU47_04370 [Candidatus Niyogibacteria bacterium CG10_big_fil_rev_8_21_14_0_10_46_36]
MTKTAISIVVPTLNEEGNVRPLVERIHSALGPHRISYEVIFIDDHSTDETRERIKELALTYPVQLHIKKGRPGKAFSLLEGFAYASYELTCMIDADLQYIPECIPGMMQTIQGGEVDIVVADRIEKDLSIMRKIASKTFRFVFGRVLHGFSCDVQSGLKVFRTQVIKEITIDPSPWTFDLEFLINAREAGYRIGTIDFIFQERAEGESKIHMLSAMAEIGWNAFALKFRKKKPFRILAENPPSMIGAGYAYKGKRFITHSTLPYSRSAIITTTFWQKVVMAFVLILLAGAFIMSPLYAAIGLMACLSALYFFDVFFNLFLVARSLRTPPEIVFSDDQLSCVSEKDLPVYTVLCPLYKEAKILPGFLEAMGALDWPKDKLDVLLLLEENDTETIQVAGSMNLPSYVRTIIVPHSEPKTKPKACNYGISLARGEYLVIYDAEDIPEPKQLKKAFLGFRQVSTQVKCLQGKLNYYNHNQNLLTRLFTAEYSLWFDVVLPGLQSVNTYIPLGGTSNHFRAQDLRELGGWDPFNVTEDCDLGARLFRHGYRTAIIDSITYEEANSNAWNWVRQRSRWIKGYIQSYLVHMRNPFAFWKTTGGHMFLFQLNVGGKVAFMLINPILWVATISYFALYALVGSTIESIYPSVIFYMAGFSLIFGNFLYFYYYMIGCAKRGHWSVIKYVFLIPVYWFFMSVAAVMALWQLMVKPHFWEKTVHGLHLKKTKNGPKTQTASNTIPALSASEENPFRNNLPWVSPPMYVGVLHFASPWLRAIERAWSLVYAHVVAPDQMLFVQRMLALVVARIRILGSGGLHAISQHLPRSWGHALSGATFLVAAMMASNAINFFFNAFLGRVLNFEELGVVIFVNTIWSISLIFMTALSTTVNHKSAFLHAEKKEQYISSFVSSVITRSIIIAGGISIVWLIASSFLADFFNIGNISVFILFTPVFSFGILASIGRGYLKGRLLFAAVGIVSLLEALIKFLSAALFVYADAHELVYLSIPISIALSAVVATIIMARTMDHAPNETQYKRQEFPGAFFGAALLTGLSATLFLSIDIVLVKHFLPPQAAGEYALLSLIGKIIYFLGALPTVFMITLVSREEGLREDTKKTFHILFGATAIFSAIGFILLGPLGSFFAPLLFGAKALAVLPYVTTYGLAIALFTVVNSLVMYNLALKKYRYAVVAFAFALVMAAGISAYHSSIAEIVRIIFISSAVGSAAVSIMHVAETYLRFVGQAVRDLFGVFFGRILVPPFKAGRKRILVFNWRDMKHVFAGGAELYIEQLARNWVKEGHAVTLFCGNDGKNKGEEMVEGVHIVRRGGFYTVYAFALLYYIFRFRGKYDMIVDCHNGIPFFTPIYAGVPIYCLMHHVHQDVFRHSLIAPLSMFARFLEKDMMPFVYRNIRFITVSESSRHDIQQLGFKVKSVEVVHPGIDPHALHTAEKSEVPMVLYLGRLKAYKSIDVLLRAFKIVLEDIPDARLVIAGSGEEEGYLKRLTVDLGLSRAVEFKGRVSEEKKIRLLQRAWVMVNPSLMEGWGITTIEANACGTPIVASDVPGLRDSVKNADTGYLVSYGSSKEFAERIGLIMRDRKLRNVMSGNAVAWAKNFDWRRSSNTFLSIINP